MKKYLCLIILVILLTPFVVNAEEKYLYDVLSNEFASGGLAKQFTGEHKDSYTEDATDNIYYWSGTVDEANAKNNAIFADHCWQIVRTTDTGGVKLLYNGEVVDNQCLSTRGNHFGYNGASAQSLNSNYWYGTDFEYDANTNSYRLTGDLFQERWSDETYENLIGKYTCRSTSKDICSSVYYVLSYRSGTQAFTTTFNANAKYNSIGNVPFNTSSNSLAYFGYMFNDIYPAIQKDISKSRTILKNENVSTTYWYSDEISYDSDTGLYSLVNPIQITDNSEVVGKYTLRRSTADDVSQIVYYIVSLSGTKMYYYDLTSGNTKESNVFTLTYGTNYRDNGDGTYTIISPSTITINEWATNYNRVNSKYGCINATNNTCEELISTTVQQTMTTLRYITTAEKYLYANSFTYDENTGLYTLNNNSVIEWLPTNNNNLYTRHYTCFNTTGVCETLSYVYNTSQSTIYYINLNNGENINTAVNKMMYNSNVNQKNSTIKGVIDSWYERNLSKYSEYLEDTIFCNNRVPDNRNYNGWNPNGGSVYQSGSVTDLNISDGEIKCENETDQFSISNPKAKLKYPIGLLSLREARLSRFLISSNYWVGTLGSFQSTNVNAVNISTSLNGVTNYTSLTSNGVARPAVSLKKGTTYLSGDGSESNPYLVNAFLDHSIFIVAKNETKDITISIDDLTKVKAYETVSLNVTPVKGYKIDSIQIIDANNNEVQFEDLGNNSYSFTMPDSDVTIMPSYERTTAAVDVEDNSHTKEVTINVNDARAVIYEDEVVFRVTPEEGYELIDIEITDIEGNKISYSKTNNENEYKFTMPDIDVTIKPVYRKIEVPNNVPNNPKTGASFISLIVLILIFGISIFMVKRKNKLKRAL